MEENGFIYVGASYLIYIRYFIFFKSSIKSRKKNKDLESSEISETNELNEISKSPEDSVISNEDNTGGSSYGVCNCHSTTGIHQSGCNEHNDGSGKYVIHI